MKITCSMCRAKTDDPQRITQYTVQELSYRKHKTRKKKSLKSMSNVVPRRPGMTFEQRERDIDMLTGIGMLACRQETLLGISNTTNRQLVDC